MRTIWKYTLDTSDAAQNRPMPEGAEVVHVEEQNDVTCLWALVDPKNTLVDRWFVVHGTGHPIEHDGTYVGSHQSLGGSFVWHVFEVSP